MVAGTPRQVIGFTVTVNYAIPTLSAASAAAQSTLLSPIRNGVPESGTQEIVMSPPTSSPCVTSLFSFSVAAPSILSSAVTVYVATPTNGLTAGTTIRCGTVSVGGVVSCTVIVNDAVALIIIIIIITAVMMH
jgi:hypothetical protein